MKTHLDTGCDLCDDIDHVVRQTASDCDPAGSRRRDDADRAGVRSMVAGENRGAGGRKRRVESTDRGTRTPGKRQDAVKLLPASEHTAPARQAAPRETQVEEAARRPAGPSETRAAADSHRAMRRGHHPEAERVPTLWRRSSGRRPRAAAAPGVGNAPHQAAGDRISAAPAAVSLLWGNDLRGGAAWRAPGPDGPAVDGLRGPVDGLLSAEQAAHWPSSSRRFWVSPAVRR